VKYSWTLDRPDPTYIQTEAEANRLVEHLANWNNPIGYDTETTGLELTKNYIVYFSFSTIAEGGASDNRFFLDRKWLEKFRPVFEDKSKTWVGSQIKYDIHMTRNSGIEIAGDLMCTLTMDRMVDPGRLHGLKDSYEREFGEKMMSFARTFYPLNKKGTPAKPKGKDLYQIMQERFETDPERVIDYASLDAWAVLRLFWRLKDYLEDLETWYGWTLFDVFLNFEVPFTRVLYNMESRGVMLDVEYLKKIRQPIVDKIEEVGTQLSKLAGWDINPSSPKQLSKFLFEKLNLEPVKRTKGGSPSTDEESLKRYAADGVEEVTLIKLLGTYVDGLLQRADANGRVHTTLNQHRADTTRLTSTDPNLQNQITSDSALFDIRKAFIASPDFTMAVSDYDQLEMYITGDYSKDETLINAAVEGRDIHSANVEGVYGEPYEAVIEAVRKKDAKEELTEKDKYLLYLRRAVKAVGFGLIYGKAARRLGIDLGYDAEYREQYPELAERAIQSMSTEKAQKVIDTFFEQIPGVYDFIQGTLRRVADTKYTETFLGNRRWFWDIMDWDHQETHRAGARKQHRDLCWCSTCKLSRDGERAAVNHIIQGCLPATTRVHTRQGMLPIGTIPDNGEVWTGHHWAPYTKLDRGECQLAEIQFDTGQTLRCDTRHEVLTVGKDSYVFKRWDQLNIGDRVCLSPAKRSEFGKSRIANFMYWLGYTLLRGNAIKSGKLATDFVGKKRAFTKEEKADEFEKFARSIGVETKREIHRKSKIVVTIDDESMRRRWKKLGYAWGVDAHERRIPSTVWSSSAKDRVAFLTGMLDADAYAGGSPRIHIHNKELLEEVQILARTLGVESKLRETYRATSWNDFTLILQGAQMAEIGYCERAWQKSRETAPLFVVKEFLSRVSYVPSSLSPERSHLYKMRHKGIIGVHALVQLAEKLDVDIKVYATAKVAATKALDQSQTTYTLSVDDPDHRFDSEGVISKNTAADIVRRAMIKCDQDVRLKELGVRMLLQVHDELVFEIPNEALEEALPLIQYHMEHPGLNLQVPLRAAPGTGRNWSEAK
jgi:DNA polymerase I-like protein with 3'-5' exonuclease and polymerase domains